MEWIKIIDRNARLPSGTFIATDGKRFLLSSCRRFNGCCGMHLSESTHYILLSDIKFPDQPERSKREDSIEGYKIAQGGLVSGTREWVTCYCPIEMRCSEQCRNALSPK